MEEQLISFETAKLAKEKGFDCGVLDCFNENGEIGDNESLIHINFNKWETVKGSSTNLYSAPTQSLLQRWLREKHNIYIVIHTHYDNFNEFSGWECIKAYHLITNNTNWSRMFFELYEEALEAGLFEALKLI